MGLDQENKIRQVLTSIVVFHYQIVSCCKLKTHAEKVYTHRELKLKLIHVNFLILNSHVIVMYLRLIKNTCFHPVKEKIAVLSIGFFQATKLK